MDDEIRLLASDLSGSVKTRQILALSCSNSVILCELLSFIEPQFYHVKMQVIVPMFKMVCGDYVRSVNEASSRVLDTQEASNKMQLLFLYNSIYFKLI